jgi:ankyrin repeat protein
VQDIHFAAFHDSLECIAFYLDNGWDVNKATTKGFTALHFACAIGAEETAVFLLERGANPNPHSGGISPLYCAAYHGSELIVGALFHFGATIKSRSNHRPGDLALRRRHFGCLLMLLEHSPLESSAGAGYSPLMRAIAMRMNDAIEPLLDLGCSADGAPVPPLYLACMQRDLGVIRLIAGRIKERQIGPGMKRGFLPSCGTHTKVPLILSIKHHNRAENTVWHLGKSSCGSVLADFVSPHHHSKGWHTIPLRGRSPPNGAGVPKPLAFILLTMSI